MDTIQENFEEKTSNRKEKVKRVFIYIGVLCLIALLVIIPMSFYIINII